MAAEGEGEGEVGSRLEQPEREAVGSGGGGGRPGTGFFYPILVGVMGPPPAEEGAAPPPPDRIVLVNPLTQGMVVLQGDPALVAEILSSRRGGASGSGGPPPASKASIEAMRAVEAADLEGWECPVCLDGISGDGEESVALVKEMPCRHRFHGGCIEKWLGLHGSCPVCRYRMPAEEPGEPKKGSGDGGDEEEGARRTRRTGLWVTMAFGGGQRGRRGEEEDEQQQQRGDREGGEGGVGEAS